MQCSRIHIRIFTKRFLGEKKMQNLYKLSVKIKPYLNFLILSVIKAYIKHRICNLRVHIIS